MSQNNEVIVETPKKSMVQRYAELQPDGKKVVMLCLLMVGVIVMLIGLTLRYNALVQDYNELLPEVNTYRTSVCFPDATYPQIVEQICPKCSVDLQE